MKYILHARSSIALEDHNNSGKFVSDRAFKSYLQNPDRTFSKFEFCEECKNLHKIVVEEKIEKRKPRAAKKAVKAEKQEFKKEIVE
tara:strand:- start:38 stop:295 length:258 start_codon:yes stop_codon:yes gene_type:complete